MRVPRETATSLLLEPSLTRDVQARPFLMSSGKSRLELPDPTKKGQNMLLESECLMRAGPSRARGGGDRASREDRRASQAWTRDAARDAGGGAGGRQIWRTEGCPRNLRRSSWTGFDRGVAQETTHEITRCQVIRNDKGRVFYEFMSSFLT